MFFVDYRDGEAKGRYDKAQALDPALVLDFIQKMQEKIWKILQGIGGEETGKIVLDHLCNPFEDLPWLRSRESEV